MSKIKLTELTNKSSLVDVDSNEAAEINGGYLGTPDYQPGGFSTYASYFRFQDNINRYGWGSHPEYGRVVLIGDGVYSSVDYPHLGAFQLP